MEALPITGLGELEVHLGQLALDSEIPLNAKLFDEVELQLTGKQIHLLNIGKLRDSVST